MLTEENQIIYLVACPLGHVLRLGNTILGAESGIVKAIVHRISFDGKVKMSPKLVFISSAFDDETNLYHGALIRKKGPLERFIEPEIEWVNMVTGAEGFATPEGAMLATAKQFPTVAVLNIQAGIEKFEYWGWTAECERREQAVTKARERMKRRARKQCKTMKNK